MSNGKYLPNKKEYSVGENIEFSCDAGFELHGASSVTCERSGIWSSVLWPHCSGMYLLDGMVYIGVLIFLWGRVCAKNVVLP